MADDILNDTVDWTQTKNVVADYRQLVFCSKCSGLVTELLFLGVCEDMLCRSWAGHRAGDGCVVCSSPARGNDLQINRPLSNITQHFCSLESLPNPTDTTGIAAAGELSESRAPTLAPEPDNLPGLRIQHTWREEAELMTWKGTVLERLSARNTLYMVKYDDVDCVYAVELFTDERVSGLQVLAEKVVNNKIKVPAGAEELVGRAVEHFLETEDGEESEWRGTVLSRAPIMTHWYYITYEKDPMLYMYQLWDDYKDGYLRVLPESENKHLLPADREPGEETESLVGKQVDYITDDGLKRTGLVIYQVPANPTIYYIKFDDDVHIYVYETT